MPVVGTGAWYLVRGRNSCGPGTYGDPAVLRGRAWPAHRPSASQVVGEKRKADPLPHGAPRSTHDMRHTLGFGKRQDWGGFDEIWGANRHSTGTFQGLETRFWR